MKQFATGMILAAMMLAGPSVLAQNTYQLFVPVDSRVSTYSVPTPFGSATVNLSCPSGAPITAVLSSAPTVNSQGGYANIFTDNYIGLTVNSSSRVNVCRNGYTDAPEGGTDCFNTAYTSAYGGLAGQDPDSFASLYGVPALDISSNFSPGPIQANFELLDFGVSLASSSVWLITNCTQTSIAPGGSVTGNPVSSTSPTPDQLTQNFPFDSTVGQRVEFIADYSAAFNAQTLTIADNTIPTVTNQALSPAAWPAVVNGTSFATTLCVPDLGEVDASGNPLCKLSTILCTNGMNSTPAGDNCPQSTAKNIRMFHEFDAPSSAVTNLPSGTGLGFLMGSDNWPASSCSFIGPETGVLCPQNPITAFFGDFRSGSGGSTTNSTFIVVSGVPLPSTLAAFSPNSSGWSNSNTVNLSFLTAPPSVPAPNNGFVPAAIQTLTYGIDSAAPFPDTSLPIPGDVTLPKTNPVICPSAPTPGALPFATNDTVTLTEGSHQLHYFATDCAGTEELVYTPNLANLGNWASFKTLTINVDTTLPAVASGPTLSPAGPYTLNQSGVIASYGCMDPTGSSGAAPSGVTVCGPPSAPHVGPTPSTGTLTSPVNTSAVGPQTFTVNVQDLAGNVGTPVSVAYSVDFNFNGFLLIGTPPTLNWAIAGLPVPFVFSLGGNQGLAVIAPGYPTDEPISCVTETAANNVVSTEAADTSFSYYPAVGLYAYGWKTSRAWKGTCRQFVMKLTDGTVHVANFHFL
jgi:hypothetical protein